MNVTASRRQFVKATGATAAMLAVAGMPVAAAFAEGDSAVKDGTYTASAQGKHAPVEVTVTVKDGKIAEIQIGENNEMPGMVESIEKTMLPLIVENQTLNVDNVTGATITSVAVVAALTDALAQAGK